MLLTQKLLNLLEKAREYCAVKNTSIIVFLNKYPNEQERKDGYYNRVEYIDSLLSSHYRIYINESPKVLYFSYKEELNRLYLNIPQFLFQQRESIIKLLEQVANTVYAHSIYQLQSPFKKKLYSSLLLDSIWDVHGAVPEEMSYAEESNTKVMSMQSLEAYAYEHAGTIISVSHNMAKHLQNKHSKLMAGKVRWLNLPIVSQTRSKFDRGLKEPSSRPIVIYAGGTQVWQQLDKMLKFVWENQSSCDFMFLTPQPEFVKDQYMSRYDQIFPGQLLNVSPDTIGDYYAKAHYGLLLRESHVLNKVACPTKLIDYISHGVVPILESFEIGDFMNYSGAGYGVDKLEIALLRNPQEFKTNQMQNHQVYRRLLEDMSDGAQALLDMITKSGKRWQKTGNLCAYVVRKNLMFNGFFCFGLRLFVTIIIVIKKLLIRMVKEVKQ